ncbi:MAG: hypothetical protein MUE40_18070 [Anaerolineae bacterium]|nr:hypothetical protein [Anaerolineae bacterium]
MPSPILTRRRWRLRAQGRAIVIVQGTREKLEHPLMKALLWALYLPQYPGATVEVAIGDRYKPDVVALAPDDGRCRPGTPIFWGEAGSVGRDKLAALVKRYPETHFAIGKWDTALHHPADLLRQVLHGVKRRAPVDLISFPAAALECIDADGHIHITHADVLWQRFDPPA